jgi:hypothetical protein
MKFSVLNLVGMKLDDAEKLAQENGFSVRLMSVDGDRRVGISNFDTNRANLHVVNGVVIRATAG